MVVGVRVLKNPESELKTEILKIPHVEAQVGGTPTFYEFDLSKAERYIGFSPSCDIVKMIVDALNYQRGEDIGVLAHG